jgi:hypothetical protein
MRTRLTVSASIIPIIILISMIFGCPTPDGGGGGGGGSTVATPSFVTASGTIIEQDTATIAITCATAGAAIHYTIDGATPTAASPTYAGPIAASLFNLPTGNGPGVVKAMATLSGSTDSTVVTATYTVQDTRAPIPVISSATTGVNDDFQITVTFDEDIPVFSGNVLSLPPSTYDTITAVSGSVYTIWIRHASFSVGNIVFNVPAGVCQDSSGIPNAVSSPDFSIFYDPNAPQAVITSTASDPTNAAPIPVRIDFGAIAVTGFDMSDLSVANGTASNFVTVIAGLIFTADITPAAQGPLTVDILANACTSQGTGAANQASSQFAIGFDTVAPNLSSVTPVTDGYAASSPVLITVAWSEAVTGFTSGNITNLVNCSVSNWTTVSGSQYTFDLTPAGEAVFSFDIAAGVCTDPAGNTSTGSASWSKTYHSTVPGISAITPATSGYWNGGALPVTIDWNEDVTSFDASDIGGLTNASVSNFTAVSGTRYTFDLTPSVQGNFSFTVAYGACTDLASNPSAGPVAWNRTYDSAAPTVSSITPAAGGYTATSPFTVTVDWSEDVSGFTSGDIASLVNCSVSNFTAVSASQYTFDLTPASEALFSFQIGSSVCADTAGNASAGTTAWSKTYHTTTPSISNINPVSSGYWTGLSAMPVTITWNEDVTGFDAADIGSLINASVSNWVAVSGSQYTFDLTPSAQGSFGFTIAASAAQDVDANNSAGPVSWSRDFDNVGPTVSSVNPATGGYATASPVTINVSWDESVSGFDFSDITSLTNCTLSNWTAVSGSHYSFDLTPSSQAAFSFQIDPSVGADQAGNASTGTTSWSKTYDATAPSVSAVTPATGGYTTAATTNVRVDWTESVTGFTSADIGTLVNCAVSNFTAVSGTQYTFDLTASAQGAFGFTIASATCADTAGNASSGSTVWTRTYDSVAPTVSSVTPATGGYTNTSPTSVTVTWSEAVTGFTSADITSLTNCALSGWTAVSGTQYTFNLTPTAQGAFSFQIAAGVCADAAGNTSTGTTAWSRTYDTVQPGVTSITSTTQTRTGRNPIPVTVVFSEAINPATFASGDFTLTNATAGTPTTADNITWTVNITPTAAGAVSVNLAAGVVQDPAGNNSTAGTALARTYITAVSYSAAAVTARGAGATRTTGNYNAGANANTIVLVSVVAEKTNAGAVDTPATTTFAGQACARITGAHQQYVNGNYSLASDMYFIMNPATRNGTASVTFTAAASEAKISVFALYDVNPGTSYGAVATNSGINVTAITTNITSTFLNSLLVDVTAGSTNSAIPTQGAGQISCWQLLANGAIGLGARKAITTIGANSMSYTALTAQAQRLQQSVIEIIIAQ